MFSGIFEDKSVQEDVIRELDWEPVVHATEIGVGVKNGIVTLSGVVESHAAKRAAERAAARVRGVLAVSSQLAVKPAGPIERTDADIAWAVANALAWNVLVPQERIAVSVTNGWVVLEGAVERRFQKVAAEDAVGDLAGVIGVTNLISLCPLVAAKELKEEIEQALRRSAEVDARHIVVEVKCDCARLWGSVRSLAQREAAELAAWSAPGLREVSNHLTIESQPGKLQAGAEAGAACELHSALR
ncbi:MAG TPA: BON domain-containing protein [Bryobacteraceae bacterium]|nr:BON domain-containing protein [Bryobacteraceae bacterium]